MCLMNLNHYRLDVLRKTEVKSCHFILLGVDDRRKLGIGSPSLFEVAGACKKLMSNLGGGGLCKLQTTENNNP